MLDTAQFYELRVETPIGSYLVVGLQVPCLTYGMRGMIAASVEVKGPARDLHSGNDGGLPADLPFNKQFSMVQMPLN